MSRLRFGIFMAPFHPAGENPTLALQRDLALVEHLDRLGYDEAWIGEHHSAGSEIIASPEIFIAAAAERTRHIKLGTGVTSLAYHNLWVTERRSCSTPHARARCSASALGRADRLGHVGLNLTDTRELMDVNFDVVMRPLPATADPVGRRPLPSTRACTCARTRAAHMTSRWQPSPRPPARAWPTLASAVGRRDADRGGLRRLAHH